MKKIDITELLHPGMHLNDAIEFAKETSFSMRCLWASEGGPIKISSKDYLFLITNGTRIKRIAILLRYSHDYSKEFERIFSDENIQKIIKEKIDIVVFSFGGEVLTGDFNKIEIIPKG